MRQCRQIVFLDAATVDYGDISFNSLDQVGNFKAYRLTGPRQVVPRSGRADVVITNKSVFNREVIGKLRRTKMICVAATGYNNVDIQAAREKGIAVTNVRGYSTTSVVQATWTFILALAGNLLKNHEAAHDGRWSRSPHFTFGKYPLHELTGKQLGVLGYGEIGRRVARIASSFGMKVLVARIPGRSYQRNVHPKRISFLEVIRRSDFLTIHAPLTPLTENLIDGRILRKMKPGSFLINMARGGIVNENALKDSLERGHLSGAACDVLTEEPPRTSHPLIGAKNCLLTPHCAWGSLESRQRLIEEIAQNIKAFYKKRKRNRIV
ncbi:MAG: D-2-hydroxyacid dehydrogenase [Candidatus Omnitrophica bacterium]|nr:D-2-hydroxyacid dehydrogenase [Candidatus Omnitrophota bacterium]